MKIGVLLFYNKINRGGRDNSYGSKETDIECFVLPQINSSFTLAKRVMINRANKENRRNIQTVLKNKKIDSLRSAEQIKALKSYKDFPMYIFDRIDYKPVEYLEAECQE